MGFTIFIIALVLILAIIIIADNKTPSYTPTPTTFQKNISVPNPETANPKDIIRFILSENSDVVEQVYHQLIQKGFKIPEQLAQLFRDKINSKLLYYSHIYWQFDIKDYQIKKENLSKYSKQYYFEIKGLHVKSYQKKLEDCVIYDNVALKKEPHNKYDPNAIKVVAQSGMIGHVPADETDEVSKIMSGEYKAFIFRISDFDRIDSDVIIYYN